MDEAYPQLSVEADDNKRAQWAFEAQAFYQIGQRVSNYARETTRHVIDYLASTLEYYFPCPDSVLSHQYQFDQAIIHNDQSRLQELQDLPRTAAALARKNKPICNIKKMRKYSININQNMVTYCIR